VPILIIGVLDLGVFVWGVIPEAHFGQDAYAVLVASLAAIPIITFCGFYYCKENMREAIAAAFILTYFSLATHIIISPGLRGLEQSAILGKLNTFVGFVIAFYFGAEVIENVFGKKFDVKVMGREAAPQTSRTEPRPTEIVEEQLLTDEKVEPDPSPG
jgi:hypothetical protein